MEEIERIEQAWSKRLVENDERWRKLVNNIQVMEVQEYGGISIERPILGVYNDGEKIVVRILRRF